MDWLTFIAALAKALAWPVVVGVILYMFGDELLKLVKEITRIKIGNFEAERKTKEATFELTIAEAKSEPLQPPRDDGGLSSVHQQLAPTFKPVNKLLAYGAPDQAVLLSWHNVQIALHHAAGSADPEASIQSNVKGAAMKLQREGLIDEHIASVIAKMRLVKNSVAHGRTTVSTETALEYVDNANRLIELLLNSKPKQANT